MKNSSDVWFIAFLISSGIKITKYDVMERGKVRCFFDLTDEEWKSYKLSFQNSEISKYKQLIEQIKDLGF